MKTAIKLNFQLIIPLLGFIFVTYLFKFWFYGTGIISYGDWYPYHSDNIKDLSAITIYNPNSLGYGEAIPWIKPLLLLTSYLSNFGFSPGWLTRLIFLLPGIIGAYWGTYLWANAKCKNILVSIICALFMLLNTYSLTLSTGHLTLYSAINFIPLGLYLYDKYIQNKDIWLGRISLLFHLFISLLISFYEFRIFIIYSGILMGYIVYSNSFNYRKIIINKGTISLIGVIIINVFWVLPMLAAESKPYGDFLVRQIFGNEFLNTNYAISITHPFWTLGGITPFITNTILFIYWAIPMLVIYLLWEFKKSPYQTDKGQKDHFYYFAIIFLIGIVFSKQSSDPFSDIYKWFFDHIPFFVLYREATKFFTLSVIGLIGMISSYNYKLQKRISYSLLGLALISILINTIPLITGEIGGVHNPTEQPQMYSEINEVIMNDSEQYNTLWIPRFSRWSYYSNDKPRVPYSDLAIFYKNQNPTVDRRDLEIISDKKFIELLTQANIKYIVGIDDEEFNNQGDIEKLISIANNNSALYTKLKETSDYVILLNNNYKSVDNVYLTREAFNLYKINISGNNDSDFDMPVKYDPNWKITTNTSLTETVLRKNWVNTAISRPISNGLQEFIVPANPDLPNQLYIQYIPDAYHKIGFILSGIFLVLVSVIILLPPKNRLELVK